MAHAASLTQCRWRWDLSISFYGRDSANTDVTDVFAAIDISTTTVSSPAGNLLVTTAPTDWFSVSSDATPNFGDYTDNYIQGQQFFVAWTDGCTGEPQPFCAGISA